MPFFGNSLTGQTRWQIFTHDGSNDADSRKDVPFRGFFHIALHLGGQNPKKPNFEAWISVFKPNSRNRNNVHFIKTTASIPTRFCTVIKTTKCSSWVVPTHALQIQYGGKIAISRPRFDRFWRNLACWRSSSSLTVPIVKNVKMWNFKKSKMVAIAILKNPKSRYLDDIWPIATKFGKVTQFDTYDASHS